MKLQKIIESLDKSESNRKELCYTDLAQGEFNIYDDLDQDWDNPRLTAYRFKEWLCTDTLVGGTILFLDDEPVAQGWQNGRKSYVIYHWFSQDAYDKVLNFLKSKIMREYPRIKTIDITEDFFH